MFFLIFGIRGLGLFRELGAAQAGSLASVPFPGKGDPFPPGLLSSFWVFPEFGVKWISQE